MLFSLNYASVRQLLDGMLLMMACYALFSFSQHRQRIYLFYAGYVLCMIARFDIRDYTSSLPYGHALENTFEALAVVAYNQFAILLMDIPHHDPPSHRMLRFMTANLIVTAGLEWLFYALDFPASVGLGLYVISRLQLVGGTVFIVPRLFRRRHPTLTWFISGTAFFVGGGFCALLFMMIPGMDVANGFAFRPENILTQPIIYMQIGVVIEVLFFTMGLSVRNRLTEQEKIQAQTELIEQLRQNEQKQQTLNRIRDDIARDLHDTVGSDLSTISLLATVAIRQPSRAPDLLDTIGQTARRVVGTMREIVWSLNSANHTPDNLPFRLREMAHELFHTEPVTVSFDIDSKAAQNLPVSAQKELLLIAKESLQNSRKHAHASQITVSLHALDDHNLQLRIQDNGVGFEPDQVNRLSGLRNLRQRAETLDGLLTIDTKPGQGTAVIMTFSVAQPTGADNNALQLP